uniref:B box-type domain-containing protein n=1 Tax=Poecilia latipinna TaxID=48699 RepID=A0A3B3TW86_9TELE
VRRRSESKPTEENKLKAEISKMASNVPQQERSKRAGSKEICLLHGEKFKLFCQVDQQPICVICRDSKTHTKHKCVPINEAAEEYRVSSMWYRSKRFDIFIHWLNVTNDQRGDRELDLIIEWM